MPTVGEYFERRVRPRIDSGVGLVKVKYDEDFQNEDYDEDYDEDSLAFGLELTQGSASSR